MSKLLGMASIGHHSRVSNWVMTKEQNIYMDLALQELKKVMDDVFPGWDTINIEVKKDE